MTRRIKALFLSVFITAACTMLPPAFGAHAETAADGGMQKSAVVAMFLNVGKADAALFMLGDKHYLVDTGTKDSADAMLQTLAFYGVDRLDGVMITHTDKDHVGGLKALLKSDIIVERLYAPVFSVTADDEHPVVTLAEKYDVTLQRLNAGDEIPVDDATRFIILGPLTLDEESEDNNSLVMRLQTPEGDMLLAGDMEEKEEDELLTAGKISPAAVLKVGHHGKADASGEAFLYTLRPQLAVISTDPTEDDDTPSPKVIRRLWNVGAEVLITNQASRCVLITLEGGNAVGRLVNLEEER